jgi:hypothetical protein
VFNLVFVVTFSAWGDNLTYGGLIATPNPSSLALLLSGAAGFVVLKRKKAMNSIDHSLV